jgi:hypothetical protein
MWFTASIFCGNSARKQLPRKSASNSVQPGTKSKNYFSKIAGFLVRKLPQMESGTANDFVALVDLVTNI